MQLNVPPDLETLINKNASPAAAIRALKMFCAALLRPRTPRKAGPMKNAVRLSSHIEEGYLQSERGELIGGAQARGEIQALRENWRKRRSPKR